MMCWCAQKERKTQLSAMTTHGSVWWQRDQKEAFSCMCTAGYYATGREKDIKNFLLVSWRRGEERRSDLVRSCIVHPHRLFSSCNDKSLNILTLFISLSKKNEVLAEQCSAVDYEMVTNWSRSVPATILVFSHDNSNWIEKGTDWEGTVDSIRFL